MKIYLLVREFSDYDTNEHTVLGWFSTYEAAMAVRDQVEFVFVSVWKEARRRSKIRTCAIDAIWSNPEYTDSVEMKNIAYTKWHKDHNIPEEDDDLVQNINDTLGFKAVNRVYGDERLNFVVEEVESLE